MYWKYMVKKDSAAPGIVPKMPCKIITPKVGTRRNLDNFLNSFPKPTRSGFQLRCSSNNMHGTKSITTQLKSPTTINANRQPWWPKTTSLDMGVTNRQARTCPRLAKKEEPAEHVATLSLGTKVHDERLANGEEHCQSDA